MILDEIVAYKEGVVREAKRLMSLDEIKARVADGPEPRNFRASLEGPDVRVIAEIKRASPSKGQIADELFDPRIIAQDYAGNGAAALSVLTEDRYFGGELFHIRRARKYMPLPIMRKDFMFDPYQIYEARLHNADAILLIVRILTDDQIVDMTGIAHELGMAALVETHNEAELHRAVDLRAEIIGINNRDLDTMTLDLATTEALAKHVPRDAILVSESGIYTREDVERVARAGAQAVLVGTSLMQAENLATVMAPLTSVYRPGFAPTDE